MPPIPDALFALLLVFAVIGLVVVIAIATVVVLVLVENRREKSGGLPDGPLPPLSK